MLKTLSVYPFSLVGLFGISLMVMFAGCSNHMVDSESKNHTPDSSVVVDKTETVYEVEGYQVIMAVTDIAVGKNRIAFAMVGKKGPLVIDKMNVRFLLLDGSNQDVVKETIALFKPWPIGTAGVYVTYLDFDKQGKWVIETNGLVDEQKIAVGKTEFMVYKSSSSPAVGTMPLPLKNLTLQDVDNISELTSSLNPDYDLYRISVKNAMSNGKPSVVTFASPMFCQTATCGPQVEIISKIKHDFDDIVDFIHIEVYENVISNTDNTVNLIVTPFMEAWNLNTEPFTFVLDSTGKVFEKFEGFVTEEELSSAIKKVTGL